MNESDDNCAFTITVPEAGRRYFGLSRNGSYAAAGRGDIPTVRVGRLLRVPVRAIERLLDQPVIPKTIRQSYRLTDSGAAGPDAQYPAGLGVGAPALAGHGLAQH